MLTARQREVVLLVVAGATNDEIAGRLFVTRRTVESHLTQAFRALGISRRGQLGALVTGAGRPPEVTVGGAPQDPGRTG